jgi:hypothetical protein
MCSAGVSHQLKLFGPPARSHVCELVGVFQRVRDVLGDDVEVLHRPPT